MFIPYFPIKFSHFSDQITSRAPWFFRCKAPRLQLGTSGDPCGWTQAERPAEGCAGPFADLSQRALRVLPGGRWNFMELWWWWKWENDGKWCTGWWWLEHEWIMTFHFIYGMSSSQVTFTPSFLFIFQRGRSTTNRCGIFKDHFKWRVSGNGGAGVPLLCNGAISWGWSPVGFQ